MTSIYVKGITEDVAKYILKTQWGLKITKGVGKLSQSQTIIHIIKEHKKNAEKQSK